MQVIKEPNGAPIKAWVGLKGNIQDFAPHEMRVDIEDAALTQLKNVARLPFIFKNGIAVMPDVHYGIGATVGSVIAAKSAVIPAAVGVDIGCGMVAIRLSLKASDLPDSLQTVFDQISRDVPVGFAMHKATDRGIAVWNSAPHSVRSTVLKTNEAMDKALKQLGTLGGGNHFIELCIDETQDVWVMLHSGSRGIGNQIGRYFIERAKELCARWHIELPHDDLAYLPEGDPVFDEYIEAVGWAQAYAFANRKLMLDLVLAALRRHLPAFEVTDEAINCHHNYIDRENHFGENLWVTRKGAVRARKDDLGIIPGSMGQRSYIVRGKGNPESYCSCSHGAGRAMSRTAARKQFTVADLIAQTEGVMCRKDDDVLDELPSGYKDIDAVMAQQTDLVEVVHTLKQVLCVKG